MPRPKVQRVPAEAAREPTAVGRLPGHDAMHGKPLYVRVEEHLRELISSGKLVPGDLIPSEPQLARSLGVSQGTAKKGIDNLVRERLLYRHQGKGTYVSRIDFNNSLFRFFSYGDAEGKDQRIHKETTRRRRLPGPPEVCRRLHRAPGTELLYVERVGYGSRRAPVLMERSWWPAELLPGLEKEELHIPDLMYAVVAEKFGVLVVRAEETLTAEASDAETAAVLGIDEGSPVVVLKRMTYTTGNQLIEFRITKGRADKFSYKTEIR
jgi:GntR family transcriptional regulator